MSLAASLNLVPGLPTPLSYCKVFLTRELTYISFQYLTIGILITIIICRYGVYSATIKLPPNTSFEYKFIEKLDCAQAAVVWENYPGGGNRQGKTPASGSLTFPTAEFEH